jgi:hypothetical protein
MRAEDKLRATWSKRENDVMLHYPLGQSTASDGHWLSGVFSKEFTEELQRRGYDVSTLRFSVEPMQGCERFASQRSDA